MNAIRRTAYLILVIAAAASPLRGETLAGRVPAGPLLYLEAKDFGGSLRMARASDRGGAWVKGPGGKAFRATRLYGKLRDRFRDWGESLGFGITIDRLAELAGRRSGLALYDVGNLRFVFVAKLSRRRWLATNLFKTRLRFEERREHRLGYHVKVASGGEVVLAFRFHKGHLILSNRADLFSAALALAAGKGGDALAESEAMKTRPAGFARGADFFLYIRQSDVTKNSYFRNYWIGREPARLGWIAHSFIGTWIEEAGIREERYFHAKEAGKLALPTGRPGGLLPGMADGVDALQFEAVTDAAALVETLRREFGGAALSGKGVRRDAARRAWRSAMTKAFAAAGPKCYALAASGAHEAANLAPRTNKIMAIRFAPTPPALAGLETATGRAIGDVLAAGAAKEGFRFVPYEQDRRVHHLTLPVFGTPLMAMATRGDLLYVASDPALLSRVLTIATARHLRHPAPMAALIETGKGPLAKATALDLVRSRKTYRAWIGALGKGSSYRQTRIRKFFGGVVGGAMDLFAPYRYLVFRTRPTARGVSQVVRYVK